METVAIRYLYARRGSIRMVSIGIDVSKEKSMVCMLKPYGEVVASPYEVGHNEQSVKGLIDRIEPIEGETRVVMEATGAYHPPLLVALKQSGIFVSVVNPLAMKKYASASIRKGKTDKLDSVRIANYGIDNWFRPVDYAMPEDMRDELRILGRQYAHYITVNVSCVLALTNLLDRTMPGIKKLIPGSRPDISGKDKLCGFVEEYQHFDKIVKMKEARFATSYCRWAKKKGYHRSEAKAKKIYALALESIPTLPSGAPSTTTMTLESVRVLREARKTLHVILSQMQELAQILPEYPVVRAMNGVGDVLAPRLTAEIGDVRRLRCGNCLVAYAGIDSPPFQPGSFTGTQRRISKRGSSLLRKTGYEVMKCLKAIKPDRDNAVYLFMLKKESEGKAKKVAKIAAFNKFLRIYYARVMEVYVLSN
jgi:transposase